jgi:hypothetical protein
MGHDGERPGTPPETSASQADAAKQDEAQMVRAPAQGAALSPDLVESLRGSRVDVTRVLVEVTHKLQIANPTELLAVQDKIMKQTLEFEAGRLRLAEQGTDLAIRFRKQDPDEIEKRRNNRVRRSIKYALLLAVPGGVGGAIYCAAKGGPITTAGLLLTLVGLIVVLLGPLASGESLSATDVVRMVGAVKGLMPWNQQEGPASKPNGDQGDEDPSRRPGKKRRR